MYELPTPKVKTWLKIEAYLEDGGLKTWNLVNIFGQVNYAQLTALAGNIEDICKDIFEVYEGDNWEEDEGFFSFTISFDNPPDALELNLSDSFYSPLC
jgi:hypothetical protein